MLQPPRFPLDPDGDHAPASATPPAAIAAIWPRPCCPSLLAALGPVLCLYPMRAANVLSGHRLARAMDAMVCLDSEGAHEALRFYDQQGLPCWRLHVLPDSDYLAWEQIVASVPVASAVLPAGRANLDWPLWRRLHQPIWRACALRLHRFPATASTARLAASEAVLSEIGQRRAQEIARAERAEWSGSIGSERA